MNEVINKFLLAGDKYMHEMHLRQPRFTYSAAGPFKTKKKEYKNLKKQGIHNIFLKMNYLKLDFDMTWLIEILKI